MSRVTIEMPDGLAKRLEAAAQQEGISIDQFLSSAAAEKLSAWLSVDYLKDRASHARRDAFVEFLDKSPAAPPLPGDE